MVRRCVMCNSNSTIDTELSFHLFPKDPEKRKVWVNALQLEINVKDWHLICSLHFTPESYAFSNERKILKQDAIPLGLSEFDGGNTVTLISQTDVLPIDTLSDALNSLVEMDHSDQSILIDSMPASLDNSTETVKAFDTSNVSPLREHSMTNKRSFEIAGCSSPLSSSRKRFLCSSRIGDMDDDDFSTPRRRIKTDFFQHHPFFNNIH